MPRTLTFGNRKYFYEIIDIDIGEGYKMMKETFKASWRDENSCLAVVKCELPLGMVIDEVKDTEGRLSGIYEISEVYEGGNAEKAGIKVGDALRACNASATRPVNDTAFVEANTKRGRALFSADGADFDNVIKAV